MPWPSPSRDRLLRFVLGSQAKNVPVSPAHASLTTAHLANIHALATAIGLPYATVHDAVSLLQEHGLVERGERLRILDPWGLFAWWRDNRREPQRWSLHVADPGAAADLLRQRHGVPTALTTYYAETAMQGLLFPRRGDVYVPNGLVKRALRVLVDEADAQLGGTNLRVLAADQALLDEAFSFTPGLAARWYAPYPQVVVDLLAEGGSAEEAAQRLIQRGFPHAPPRLS